MWGVRAIQTMTGALGFPGGEEGKFDAATHQAFTDCLVRSVARCRAGRRRTRRPPARSSSPHTWISSRRSIRATRPANGGSTRRTSSTARKRPLGAPGDLQGCSEFNPQMILARDERRDFEQRGKPGEQDRNAANEPNRRVVIYVFDKGTEKPATWPCPAAAAANNIKGCKDRFWSDGDKRVTVEFVGHRRRFGKAVPDSFRVLDPRDAVKEARFGRAETTFGCRFYHGFALRLAV